MQPIWQTGLSNSRGATRRAARLVIVDPAQHVGERGLLIDVVEFGRRDQRVHRAGALATAIGAGE